MRASAQQARRIRYAVALSVVVHAIALFGVWPALRESLQEPVVLPPLVTRLVELAQPPEPAPAEEKKPPPPRPEARKPEPPKPALKPTPAPSVAEPPPPAPAPAQPEPPPAPVASAAPPAPVALPQVDARAAEAATAAQYRMQLIAYAQRNKPPYPAIARENNWAGDVVLEIVVRADGRGELGLRRASGHAVLDKLALDTYQEALRAVPVPPSLRGKHVRLEPLRVIYNLTE
ncbi:MAG: periplasmic protein TonB [Betaproteobacteria bacterium]|jgi:protein TonB|nr:periplasmic protein TonB [Betaproteobacteria bacterium]